MQAEVLPKVGGERVRSAATYLLASALILRGVGGPFMNSGSSPAFARLNTRVYIPLCLALGGLTLSVELTR